MVEDVHQLSIKEYLINSIRKNTKQDIKNRIDQLNLSNGKSYSVSFETPANHYYYRIILINSEKDGVLYEVIGNETMDFEEAKLILDYHSTKVQ